MRKLLPFLLVLSLLLPWQAAQASHAPALTVTDNRASLDFPNTLIFSAKLQGDQEIRSVVLEYGTKQLTCGEVFAKAFPEFEPGKSVEVSWTWEMRQSGSLPPGAALWWRWRVIYANGQEAVSDTSNITWLDSRNKWKTITSGDLRLHWYRGDEAYARELLTAAEAGLQVNKDGAGLEPDGPIDLYIYANTDDLKDAVLYEPSWTGGQAFSDYNIVIIGIAPNEMDWGKDAIVHELTHVLVGHLTFSCLGDVPTWLNEGLAVYSEGDLDSPSQKQLDDAIRNDTLLSVRSLSGGFSEVSSKANLSYSQSYSIVKFLIDTYGQEKMNLLLLTLRDGTSIDDSLQKVYGFNVEGLEDAWRKRIGAKPRAQAPNPTATPQPTIVPTYVPVSGAPLAVTPTPFAVPTSSANPQNQGGEPVGGLPSSSDTLTALALVLGLLCCCLVGLIVIGVVIYLVTRKKGEGHA